MQRAIRTAPSCASRCAVAPGTRELGAAADAGADVYVTSDLRHHVVAEFVAVDGNPAVVEVAHWAGEWPWLARAAGMLDAEFGGRRPHRGVDPPHRPVDPARRGRRRRLPVASRRANAEAAVTPKVDPFVQLRLLEVARLDQAIDAAQHRRRTLPELEVIRTTGQRVDDLGGRVTLAQAEIGDIDAATRKLEHEIEAVRARAARDQHRLADGLVPPKDLSNLQSEIVSLSRRQASLEDEELELMERRESAAAALAEIERDLERAGAELAAAEQRRDDAFADIDDELARSRAQRDERASGAPADLLALYERIRSSGKVGAARLAGSRCEACRMDLDRVALAEIHAAGVDTVVRCPECGAILVRS